MILSNLRKSFWRMNTAGNFPVTWNGSTDANFENNPPNNSWIIAIPQNNGGGCDFPLNSIGYTYSGYRGNYTYLRYNYKTSGQLPGFFVAIGTGNTAENSSDYCLASIDTQLEHRYGHVKRDPANGVILQVESVYENLTGGDITIKEIGLVASPNLNTYGNGSNWTNTNFLIARKVLASPVTIHNNEVYKFIYKIDI